MTAPHDPSRRICLQTLGAAVGVLHAPAAPAATTATLNWSNWDANAHAHCLAPFTAARHIAVRRSLVTGADNQFATLMAGGGREWDAIAPNIETVGQFIRAGLLQKIDLARLLQLRQCIAQQRLIPGRVLGNAVVGEPQGVPLRRRQVLQDDHRHLGDAERLRCLEPPMARDQHAVLVD